VVEPALLLLLVELTEVVLDPAEAAVDDLRGCEEEEGEGEAVRSLSSFLSLDLDESELDLALESCYIAWQVDIVTMS